MRRAIFIFAAAASLALAGSLAAGPIVSAKGGNIYLSDDVGTEKQLTSSGRDSAPLLAPDRKWVVFVRSVDGKKVITGGEDGAPAELWQVRADGKEPTLLLRTRNSEKPENLIAAFDNLQFSSDGRLVYFVTPAWATSGAVRVVDTTNRKERFVMPGNSLEVVHSGEYRDCLLVQQHRYFVGGGSYDWFWLFRPDGKEEGPIGEDTEGFKSLHMTE